MTPIMTAPAAISSTPSPSAIAIAPNALSGCTGTGKRYRSALSDVQKGGREEHGGGCKAVRDDQRHRDGHQHAKVGHGARPLMAVEGEPSQRTRRRLSSAEVSPRPQPR